MGERRPSDWKQTYSGIAFWPLDPRPEEVCIADIAHSLALVCRYGGHCPEPYSVAQHSVLVSHQAEVHATAGATSMPPHIAVNFIRNVTRWGLLHDAGEAYLGDMVRPLKRTPEMVAFREAEGRVMEAIRVKFWLIGEEPREVKQADNEVLLAEARDFFPENERPRPWGVEGEPIEREIRPWTWEMSERRFLRRFRELWPEAPRG